MCYSHMINLLRRWGAVISSWNEQPVSMSGVLRLVMHDWCCKKPARHMPGKKITSVECWQPDRVPD